MLKRWLLFLILAGSILSLYPTLTMATVNEPSPSAANRYTANGSTFAFPYTFEIYDQTALSVSVDGALKILTTDYTVSGVNNSGGGSVTFILAPANGSIVTILRDQPQQQTSIYTPNEAFPAKRIEHDLDKLAMQVQQLQEQLNRTWTFHPQSALSGQMIDPPITGNFARAKAGGGIDWASAVPAGSLAVPVGISDGGTGSTTIAAMKTAYGLVLSAIDYGAIADDGLDDTAALQAALDATPSGGTLLLPAGVLTYSTLSTDKPITLQGMGWQTTTFQLFGHSDWNSLTKNSGTILRSTATSGTSLTFNHATLTQAYNLRDLAIIGPGSGTSVGIAVGSASTAAVMGDWQNVLIANFATGLNLTNVQDHTFTSLRLRGNTTNLSMTSCYQNVFNNLELQKATTGLAFNSGSLDTFYGGLVQGNTTGLSFINGASNGGEELIFDGLWFESNSTQNINIDSTVSAWTGLTFANSRMATGNGPNYVGATTLNYLRFENNQWAGANVTIPAHALNTLWLNNNVNALTDSGSNTHYPVVRTGFIAFGAGDTTPSVSAGQLFTVTNAAPTTITTFDNGYAGQEITLLFTDANTTIAETDNIKLSAAFTSSADDTMRLIFNGTNWYELSRSVN